MTLTGTIFGGYSSTLFYLLWRFSPAVRQEFGYHGETKWVSRYGIVERITKKDPNAYSDDGRQSKRRSYLTRTVEKPGVSPAILFHLIGNTVFLRLADLALDLPAYTERVARYPLDRGQDPEKPSQAGAYHQLATELRQAVTAALQQGSKRLLATYLQALLAYPDACTHGETVLDSVTGDVIAHAPALSEETRYPKEQALLELVLRERARGRRVLIYITHTKRRDISPRLRTILEREGFRVAVLKAGTVPPDRREEWVAARVWEGTDVLICHPHLVQTGLDLVDWPSIVWFETEYSVYVMRQASRRSWRIGQRQPVEVTYLVYEGTLQAEALRLAAAKLRASLMVEGELPDEGLAALEGDSQDLFLALARRLTGGHTDDAQSLEALFAQTKAIAAQANDYLIDGVWVPDRQLRPTPTPAEPSSNRQGTDPIRPVHAGEQPSETTTTSQTSADTSRQPVAFDELAHLVRRPASSRKPVSANQLRLFDD
ncbi:DEAD-like helicase (fragment) [Nitrolancea hollandica Lb]|uniref:DEAD-like helicase n=1 Tax=Nitrolancea hollandica Lb TaxID=1129897 RepID=I4ELD6_9BACT